MLHIMMQIIRAQRHHPSLNLPIRQRPLLALSFNGDGNVECLATPAIWNAGSKARTHHVIQEEVQIRSQTDFFGRWFCPGQHLTTFPFPRLSLIYEMYFTTKSLLFLAAAVFTVAAQSTVKGTAGSATGTASAAAPSSTSGLDACVIQCSMQAAANSSSGCSSLYALSVLTKGKNI